MLPEHVEAIQKLWKEDERVEKAILDEQQLEEIEFALQRAKSDGLPVELNIITVLIIAVKVKVLNLEQEKKVRCL